MVHSMVSLQLLLVLLLPSTCASPLVASVHHSKALSRERDPDSQLTIPASQAATNTKPKTAAALYTAAVSAEGLHGANTFAYLTQRSNSTIKAHNQPPEATTLLEDGHLRGSKVGRFTLSRKTLIWIVWIQFFIILCGAAFPLVAHVISTTMGEMVRQAVETWDTDVLGVDVTIEDIYPNIFNGIFNIHNLTIMNPPGWDSPYLLKAGVLHVDFDMLALLKSGFCDIELEEVKFKDVHVVVEKSWNSSNVQDLLNLLHKNDPKAAEQEAKAKSKGWFGRSESEARHSLQASFRKPPKLTEEEEDEDSPASWVLHKVELKDIGARVQGKMIGGRGVQLSVGDIMYTDFTTEVGDTVLDDVVKVLLKSVLKTVVANTIGRESSERCF